MTYSGACALAVYDSRLQFTDSQLSNFYNQIPTPDLHNNITYTFYYSDNNSWIFFSHYF